jgi:acetyl-CoA carboxylase carboxyltransferase component
MPKDMLSRLQGGVAPVPRRAETDQLTAHQRLELLCDPGSLKLILPAGDGVVAAFGTVDRRPIVCYAQDRRLAAGSLGAAQADAIVRALNIARDLRVPVIAFIESAGARIQEGVAGLAGYARIFAQNVALSGVVPQISIVTGTCAGGGAYSPALTDFVIMPDSAAMFLTGPKVVLQACGEDVTRADLGGPRVHRRNGVCDVVAQSEADAVFAARDILSYLPQRTSEAPPVRRASAPPIEDPAIHLPERSSAVYDVRAVIRSIADSGELLEFAPRWARNVVIAFARIGGRPVGFVASQPRYIGGVLDAKACVKAARFVNTCDAYGLPLVVLVDTPGFMPGKAQEEAGIIRHGAQLVEAFASATVPRFTVVLRKAYGGAYIAMNAKDLGATKTFAWSGAEIGVMDAGQGMRIVHGRRLAASPAPDELLAELTQAHIQEHCSLPAVAAKGFVDEIIEPRETRARLDAALGAVAARSDSREWRYPSGPPALHVAAISG